MRKSRNFHSIVIKWNDGFKGIMSVFCVDWIQRKEKRWHFLVTVSYIVIVFSGVRDQRDVVCHLHGQFVYLFTLFLLHVHIFFFLRNQFDFVKWHEMQTKRAVNWPTRRASVRRPFLPFRWISHAFTRRWTTPVAVVLPLYSLVWFFLFLLHCQGALAKRERRKRRWRIHHAAQTLTKCAASSPQILYRR